MENFLKNFLANQKAEKQRNKEKEISDTFDIRIKDNKLWVVHEGYAIREIEDTTTAQEVVELINNYRQTAIKYKEQRN